jgi:hypothetical protein
VSNELKLTDGEALAVTAITALMKEASGDGVSLEEITAEAIVRAYRLGVLHATLGLHPDDTTGNVVEDTEPLETMDPNLIGLPMTHSNFE